jgi:hypothetical protein
MSALSRELPDYQTPFKTFSRFAPYFREIDGAQVRLRACSGAEQVKDLLDPLRMLPLH